MIKPIHYPECSVALPGTEAAITVQLMVAIGATLFTQNNLVKLIFTYIHKPLKLVQAGGVETDNRLNKTLRSKKYERKKWMTTPILKQL